MNKFSVIVDLKKCDTQLSVEHAFSDALGLTKIAEPNWDRFDDIMGHLDSDSDLVKNMKPMPEWVHLVIKNHLDFVLKDKVNAKILAEILFIAQSNPAERAPHVGDNIKFTFEVEEERHPREFNPRND